MSGFEHMPVPEWLCLALGRSAGFEVPETALVDMPDGVPPALPVERFDIRTGEAGRRRIGLEDFCSILGVSAEDKYKGTIERMAYALRPAIHASVSGTAAMRPNSGHSPLSAPALKAAAPKFWLA
jgi:serine/threonine-protein kinase HipA